MKFYVSISISWEIFLPSSLSARRRSLSTLWGRSGKLMTYWAMFMALILRTLVDSKNTSSLTDELSIKLGRSLRVLCPPVSKCILCDQKLSVNNQPVQIVVHTLMGPKMYSKYILRCKNCRLTTKEKYKKDDLKLRQDMYYHPDKVSKSSSWRKYYTFSCIDHSSLYFVT